MKFINVIVTISFAASLLHVTNAGSPSRPCDAIALAFNRSLILFDLGVKSILIGANTDLDTYFAVNSTQSAEEYLAGTGEILESRAAQMLLVAESLIKKNSVANNLPIDTVRDFVFNGVIVSDYPLSCILNIGEAVDAFNAAIANMKAHQMELMENLMT